ncbi:MAG: methylated-DNA--[protein]-cysteine S-methyltransferase [bacterium]
MTSESKKDVQKNEPVLCLAYEVDWGWLGAILTSAGLARHSLLLEAETVDAWLTGELGALGFAADQCRFVRLDLFEKPDAQSSAACPFLPKLIQEARAYFQGDVVHFDVPLDWRAGSDFQRKVWRTVQDIPYGEVRSYGEVAILCGHPGAARAVGTAMSKNQTGLIVPCHRVVAANSIGGFSTPAGTRLKKRMIEWESRNLQKRETA